MKLWRSKATGPTVEKQPEQDTSNHYLFNFDEDRSAHGKTAAASNAASTSGGDDSMHRRREMAKQKRGQSHMSSARDAVLQLAGILSPTAFFEHKVRSTLLLNRGTQLPL